MIVILYKIKPSIYQTQLTDFKGQRSIEKYDMSVPKDYRVARKKFGWILIHPTWGKRTRESRYLPSKSQKRIQDFINWIPKKQDHYVYRFPRVKIPRYEEHGKYSISKMEWDMHRYLKSFDGFFENLFELNDFSYFQDLQGALEDKGVSFKNMFLEDVIAYELLRLNLGFKDYRGIEKMSKFMRHPPLVYITHDHESFPNAADLSHVLTRIPAEALFEYFQLLVKECVDCGIIVPRTLIWDGQFIRSNCNNNKDKKSPVYNDPDAGYCRHNSIKKGVGYDPGILYAHCFNRWFPIYFKMSAGNRNDIRAFRETMEGFFHTTEYEWQIVIADSVPYSLQNMKTMQHHGLMPIIRARKNLKTHPIRQLKKDFYFNTEFIPTGWSDELFLKIFSFRPMIEQGNSYNNTYYNAFRMNTRGIDAAIRNRSLIYILVLLKALTGYKLGRPDLVMKPTAFENSRYYYGGTTEYPLDCLLYRRPQELEKCQTPELYVLKNELARQLIQKYHTMGFPCKTWVMDSYFMTKENVKLLTSLDYSYVSKIKRNWVVTYQRQRQNVEQLHEEISEAEFDRIDVRNPKTKKKRYFSIAHRDVFIPKIGVHRIIFMRELVKEASGQFIRKYEEGWTCLVSSMVEEDPCAIIQAYMKRWTIETSYRDDTQELHLKGCMFRNVEGQYCFITLVFLAYRLLTWASRLGLLSTYKAKRDTVGKKRAAFRRFHEEVFGEWISSLKKECESCNIAKVIYTLIHGGNPHAIESR